MSGPWVRFAGASYFLILRNTRFVEAFTDPITATMRSYALADGKVMPDGIDLNVLTDMDSTTRHWRFLRNQEFDAAEISCSSYLVARDHEQRVDVIPVFLHRRFRHGFLFINTAKGIRAPGDLAGRKVSVKQFQATAIVWMRGILQHAYGVPLNSIEWFSDLDKTVDFEPRADFKITRVPPNASIERMLAEGEIDALLHPDLIRPLVEKDPRVARHFPDYRRKELPFTKRPASSRSCMFSASSGKSLKSTHGSPSTCSTPSTTPRTSR